MGERNENLDLRSISVHTCKWSTCHTILRHGASGLISPPKGGVLRTFIALQNPTPRPGLNQRSLCQIASTLTTTPPRRTTYPLVSVSLNFYFRRPEISLHCHVWYPIVSQLKPFHTSTSHLRSTLRYLFCLHLGMLSAHFPWGTYLCTPWKHVGV
jgi:hypothetical protein